MKARAAELRAEGKTGAKQADGLQAVLDAIAKMTPQDRALAERVHVTITATAPDLSPKTWYGLPAYTNAAGKIVVAFKNSGKFNTRYSTLEFQDAANLDDGDIRAVSYAVPTWSAMVEKKIAELGAGRNRTVLTDESIAPRGRGSRVARAAEQRLVLTYAVPLPGSVANRTGS